MPENTLFQELDKIDGTTIQCVNDVIKSGVDVTIRGNYGESCLHNLCSPDHVDNIRYVIPLVYMLNDAGVDVNIQDHHGNTVLHVCAINEPPLSLLLTFLRLGADTTIINKQGVTALEYTENQQFKEIFEKYSPGLFNAVRDGDEEKVKDMEENWFHLDRKCQGQRLEKIAKKNGHNSLHGFIKSHKAQSSFIRAVYSGNVETVKELLDKVDVDISNKIGERSWPLIAEAMYIGYTDVVKVLLKNVDVNQIINTPLDTRTTNKEEMEATSKEMKMMDDLSDNVEEMDAPCGSMPLFQYILLSVNNPDGRFIKLLFKKADLSLYSGDPIEQLYSFWKRGFPDQVVDSYIKLGFQLASRFSAGLTLRERILVDCYRDQTELWQNMAFVDNVIIKMVKSGDMDTLNKLLQSGYTGLLVRDEKGQSTLQIAQESGADDIVQLLENVPNTLATVSNIHTDIQNGNLQGVKRNMQNSLAESRDRGGRTLLHKAVLYDRKFIINYLLKNYPKIVNLRDMNGRTALHYACCLHEDHDIENRLIQTGVDQSVVDLNGKTALDYKISNYGIIDEERNAQYGWRGHLLSTYLSLCDMIEENETELIRLTLDNMADLHIDDVNKLPELFPDLDFKPLLFQCVYKDRETLATLMLMKGASPYAKPVGGQQTTLLETAENVGMFELVALLKKKMQTHKSSPELPWQYNTSTIWDDSSSSWRDDGRSSTESFTPPPYKKVNHGNITPLPTHQENEDTESMQQEQEMEQPIHGAERRRSSSCIIL